MSVERLLFFAGLKKGVDELVASLSTRGFIAEGLHGDLSQSQRDRVMKRFRDAKLDILVATDVAARGLDIENICYVVNFDIPQDPESYVHRIGRTGRAGKKGTALTFITPREYKQLKQIEKETKARIFRKQLPTSADILVRQKEVIKHQLIATLEQGRYADYHEVVADLADYEALDIAAAALKLYQEGFKETVQEEEKPAFINTGGQDGMVRLFINAGRTQEIRPEDIVRTFAEEAGIPGNVIGVINIYDKFSFVEVSEDVAERVLAVMHRNVLKGHKISVEPAKGR